MVHASELQSGKRDERYPQQFVLWVPRRRDTLRDDAEELSVLPLSLCVMEMILLPPGVLPPTPQGAGLTSLSSCFQYQIHSLLLQ